MHKTNRLSRVLQILLGLSIILTLFFQLIKPSSLYQNLDQSFFTFTSYIKYVLFQSPIQTMKDAVNGFTALKEVQGENEVLRQNLLEVYQLQTRLIEANKENVELKDLLSLKENLSNAKMVSANVIEKDATNFNNTILLNVGSNDGVEMYMAVITPSGLIGQITSVSDNTSIVRLLTSQDGRNQFALKIQLDEETTVEAILESYDLDNQRFKVRLLDSSKTVKEGMKVVTSGLGEIIPSGLLVGEIESIENSPATLSVILHVIPAASFSDFNIVMVVSKP